MPYILSSDFMASVSWISPPTPGVRFSIWSNISGVRMYLPVIARFEGAS
jgi:hypothetical protein